MVKQNLFSKDFIVSTKEIAYTSEVVNKGQLLDILHQEQQKVSWFEKSYIFSLIHIKKI